MILKKIIVLKFITQELKKNYSGKIVTNGGRVLNIIGKANTIKIALELAYSACKKIYWKGCLYRRDIGS